jgi:hypothetical protein
MDDVYLQCVQEGAKLRVRIISHGYFQNANCQFPRALREANRYFSVPASSVRLAQTNRGTYFYRVKQPITVLRDEPTIQSPQTSRRISTDVTVPKKRKAPEPSRLPEKVYENEDPDCVICLDMPKEIILSPCGHFCLCKTCSSKLSDVSHQRKCPMCRQVVVSLVTPEMMQ